MVGFISKIFENLFAGSTSSGAVCDSVACEAARVGNVKAVMELIEEGTDINITGGGTLDFSPLMWASEEGNVEMLKLLIEKGADPNLTNERGMCALLLAAKNGHVDAARLLLDNGANIHLEMSGVTPLHAAAAYEHPDMVQLLLQRGAIDNNGLALESATQKGNDEIINLLKQSSA